MYPWKRKLRICISLLRQPPAYFLSTFGRSKASCRRQCHARTRQYSAYAVSCPLPPRACLMFLYLKGWSWLNCHTGTLPRLEFHHLGRQRYLILTGVKSWRTKRRPSPVFLLLAVDKVTHRRQPRFHILARYYTNWKVQGTICFSV
jgi:hypothetical protein